MLVALDVFTPQVAEWFTRAFDRPTPVQEQAWPLIAGGEHVLISAPTGSGKTIAAFLYGLDRLSAQPLPDDERRVRLLYVSPLKALSHDVDRNLRAPLRGIAAAAGEDAAQIKVALRTGDTPQRERAAMRRKPPDVLITTPESLFLMLTSGAREMLTGVETVIVDEIHAVAGTKRGSHLALTLERLSALRGTTGELRGSWAGEEVQRVGLSATQNPLEEVGRFLVGPGRQCRIVETGEKKRMDLRIQVPVESMTELDTTPAGAPKRPETDGIDDTTMPLADPDDPDASDDDFVPDGGANVAIAPDPLEPVPGGEATRNSIWPAMYPEILDLVEQHRSTIVFVNSRRSAERLALRLNELAEQRAEDQAREAGTDDPAQNPDARWDEDPDAARARRDGDLRRLIAGRDGVVPGDETPEDDDDPDAAARERELRARAEAAGRAGTWAAARAHDPDEEITLTGPDRHAQIQPLLPRPAPGARAGGTPNGATPGAAAPSGPTPDGAASPTGGASDADSGGGPAGSQTRVIGVAPTGPHAVEVARAHHGSLSREEREVVEELLKAGKLPCLVATSSLELGIDMGSVDLVLQIESPKSVAAGLQRIGRAGHGVGETAKGRIFPKFRADLLECAVVVRRMREGLIEPTVVPRNPLDVLAQQIVAIAASADEDEGVTVDDVFALVTRTYPYAELPRELFERTLDMLDGRYPSQDFAELRPRVVWDRVGGTIRPRKGAGRLAIANAGTIPDRGLYRVVLPDGRRVGELDEEMVYEARAGQTFLLGASTWRIEEIGRDKVVVTPAPGAPGAVPFWRGDQRGRPKALGEAIGAFSRWAVDQDESVLERDYDLDPLAARNLRDFLIEQQDATGVVPSDTTLVIERFKDEIGDWRVCLLSPYGGRVHAAWGLAVSRQIRDELGLEADAIWSDDGIIIHLPDVDEPVDGDPEGRGDAWGRIVELLVPEPDEVEDLIVSELGTSALFGARFRENAGRALLIPRARPGQRTPLWQQRLKAQTLLEVAQTFPDFPVILETYRECLRDVLDVPGLVDLLGKLQAREVTLVEVETQTASPMASSLLFDYIATYMYEGDAPNAERRAAALSLDRDLLRELLGQDELRELLDEGALAQLEADLQHRSPRTRAGNEDALAEVLRRVGDLTDAEVAERVAPPEGGDAAATAAAWLETLDRHRRAIRMRIGGELRWIAADDAGLYRDALGAVPPGGLPETFLADVPDPYRRLVVRYAATHGPFVDHELRDRYGVDPTPVLRELLREDLLVRGEIRPGGTETEHCDPEVLRRLRRMSLAVLRQEIEPVDPRALVPFSLTWQGIDRYRPAGAGPDRLREALVPLQGLALPVELWENEVLPRRLGAYSPAWLDGLCASGEVVWVGAGALGRSAGKVALYFREDIAAIGPPMGRAVRDPSLSLPAAGAPGVRPTRDAETGPSGPAHEALRALLATRPAFFAEMLGALPEHAEHLRDALWDLVWAGEVTCDVFAPLRAGRAGMKAAAPRATTTARSRGARRRFGPRAATAPSATQGRFSLTAPLFAPLGDAVDDPGQRRRVIAELLLERHGIVTREHVRAEGISGGFSTLYDSFGALETLGVCRRGYFVEGLGGAQFALPGAVERLRGQSVPTRGPGGEVSALDAAGQPLPATTLDATDPAQPYGTLLRWPEVPDEAPDAFPRRPATATTPHPQRSLGARVVVVGPDPVLFCDRSGKSLQTLVAYDDPRLPVAFAALVEAVSTGKAGGLPRKGLQLERIDGLEVIGHPLEGLLPAAGFRAAPTKYLARA
ncbi:DEAD/DEAH box helicase [Patulibacter sp. SYSU D01012]|uniref:DEAD/DEAH box helicase n=1 Tax=Patulibacter sp. SYSU D01012 TaxID=2817381 RepID=UPI001B30C0B2|nr:DEAD/DEAH box helicase [Patulibacter sp. SYSU D01012]